jgi:hypothetical protein
VVLESQVGLKLNWAFQLLVYVDNMNLLGDNIDTIKKDVETVIDDSKEIGLEVNAKKPKYMLLSRHQNAGQNHDINIANRSFEKVAQFKHLGTAVRNQILLRRKLIRN